MAWWRLICWLVRRPLGPWLVAASAVGWTLQASHGVGHEALDEMVALCSGGQVSLPNLSVTGPEHGPGLLAWLAMVLGMAPLVLRNEVALLWNGTLPRLRWSAIAAFVGGYALPWLALGAAWLTLPGAEAPGGADIAVAAGLVVAWHCSPTRQSLLNSCHAPPVLRAFGLALRGDAARFGLRTGGCCCAICGPAMMLALMVPAHHMAAMAAATLILVAERYRPARRLVWQAPWPSRRREPHWLAMTLPSPPGPAG